MEHARSNGFPVPEARPLSDTEIVMRRLKGPTMLDELGRKPWLIGRHAATLASLHRRLHEIEAPDWLLAPLGEGTALLHLDLHPDNVILTAAGPVVIDWPNVARGPGAADVAYTWIILSTASSPREDLRSRVSAGAGRRFFLRAFFANFDRAELAAVRKSIPIGAALRLEDRNVPPQEREKVARLARPEGLDV